MTHGKVHKGKLSLRSNLTSFIILHVRSLLCLSCYADCRFLLAFLSKYIDGYILPTYFHVVPQRTLEMKEEDDSQIMRDARRACVDST